MGFLLHRSSCLEVFCKEALLKVSQNSQENTSVGVFFKKEAGNFIKKETLTQMFSCEFCETFKNIYFYKTHLVAASCYIRSVAHLHDHDHYTLSKRQNESFWCQGLFKYFNSLKYHM